ncbi:MAG: dipicolinate synthase subunit DpsA [Ruminococcus sp.]|nr:dipicolinate synthase subunit DpsA [Ruminococcus sp.]
MDRYNFLVVGGDLRQIYLAEKLARTHKVCIYGTDRKMLSSDAVTYTDTLDGISADYTVLPVPASNDGATVNAPLYDKAVTLSSVADCTDRNGIIFGGKITTAAGIILRKNGAATEDYLEREELSVLNAVATSEGAIQLAMEETATTIFGRKILITGFGRIAKTLARVLVAMGAKVTVCVRKKSDIVWAEICGCKGVHISHLRTAAKDADIIFNTIPTVIMGEEILSAVKSNALLIDLASKPGGVDFGTAGKLGIKTIWALSLPGKIAPVTSGEIIADTILGILEERRCSDG